MNIGLNIADGVRVRIGDKLDDVTASMDKHNVIYTIPYRAESNGDINIVMFMEECGVELNIVNEMIVFIKSNNSESNYIMQLMEGMTPIEALNQIRENLATSFNINKSDIRIDRFDGRSLNSMLSIPLTTTMKIKLELIMGLQNKIYLHSLELSR